MITKITLPKTTLPSWNKFYSGMHWAKRKEIVDFIHHEMWAAIKEQKIERIKYNGRTLAIHTACYFPNRRTALDPDNICDKVVIDALKESVIEDDDWRHIRYATTESRVDSENPRTEIDISYI